jgi:hypothetical protein
MKKYIIILFMGLWAFTSCADYLDQEPANQVSQEQIMAILASGDSIQIDIILGGLASGLPNWIHRDLGGSETRNNSYLNFQYAYHSLQGYDIAVYELGDKSFGYDAYRYHAAAFRTPLTVQNEWRFGWKCVAEANRMLGLLPDEVVGSNKRLKNYKASALTLRAFAYNFLMENYRGAYQSSGEGLMIYDKIGGTYKSYSTAGETYDFIKKDLADAVRLYGESEIGESKDGYTVANTEDLDLAVANFVRAHVSLTTGDYATAIAASNAILAKYPKLISVDNYGGKNTGTATEPVFQAKANAFLDFETNPEIIFGFHRVVGNRNAHNIWMNIFGSNYGGESGDYGRIVNTLYDAIAPTDVRKGAFVSSEFVNYVYPHSDGTTGVRTIPTYANLKYAANYASDGSRDAVQLSTTDVCYMRVSEVLLIKAEAQAASGDETGAKNTLNTLLAARSTDATLTCDNYGVTGNALELVKLQWRIEMWGENGLEFYNNKRWNVSAVRNPSTSIHSDAATITTELLIYPIPANETLYNPNL